jgi:hypothetical protein
MRWENKVCWPGDRIMEPIKVSHFLRRVWSRAPWGKRTSEARGIRRSGLNSSAADLDFGRPVLKHCPLVGPKVFFLDSHCEREGNIRIIGARPVTPAERMQYEEDGKPKIH